MTSRLDPESLAYCAPHGEPAAHCPECWADRQAVLAPVEREGLHDYRLRVLQRAEREHLIVPLTGPSSVLTPWPEPEKRPMPARPRRADGGRECWTCGGTGEVPKYMRDQLTQSDIDAGLHRQTIECPEPQCIGGTFYPKEHFDVQAD